MSSTKEKTLYIDASGQILGRLASIIAKKLLEGFHVYVFNAEKAVISGKRSRVIESYKKLLKVRSHVNPEKGVKRPRNPVNIFKHAVRGMLPKTKPHGREAFKRLKVYIGIPPDFVNVELVKFNEADCSRLRGRYITVEEVSRSMGWKGGEIVEH
ncbi:MAG: 50S ribosomal protein L13 [Desulfurococcaceae archaeon]